MATMTKLPLGKYRAQTFLRKLDPQAWSSELERSIEGGSLAGVIQPPFRMLMADVIDACLRQVRVSKAGDLSLQQISSSIAQTPARAFNALRVRDRIAERPALRLK